MMDHDDHVNFDSWVINPYFHQCPRVHIPYRVGTNLLGCSPAPSLDGWLFSDSKPIIHGPDVGFQVTVRVAGKDREGTAGEISCYRLLQLLHGT